MKSTIEKVLLTLTGVMLSMMYLAPAVQAAGASMYLSPASGTYSVGSNISVAIYENSNSDQINSVQAYFSYPAGVLTYTGVTDSSVFTIDVQNTNGGGQIKIVRSTCTNPCSQSSLTGLQLVATVHFTAAAAGSAPLVWDTANSNIATTSATYENPGFTNSSYTVSAPASPPPSSTPSPSPSPSSPSSGNKSTTKSSSSSSSSKSSSSGSSSSGSTSPPPAAPQVLTITSISTSNLSPNTVTVNWKTTLDASSEVDYGPGTKYFLSAVDSTLTKNHSVSLSSVDLMPNSDYHYIVKSVDAKGELVSSEDKTFTTKTPVTSTVAKPVTKKGASLLPVVIIVVVLLAAALAAVGLPQVREKIRSFLDHDDISGPGPSPPNPPIMVGPSSGPASGGGPGTTVGPSKKS